MRELYKNPLAYYVVAPVLVCIWPLLVWAYYLPQAKDAWQQDRQLFDDAQTLMVDILGKDPDRLVVAKETQMLGEFSYADAVNRVANLCRIPSGSLDLNTGSIVKTSGRETQQARVSLSDVSIVQAAKFLSQIQSTWVNLTCDRIKLTKKEGMPDQWDMALNFKYDY
ncbi:MAG: hypothetical protein JSW27_12510 [Phycisphaerales bacterium]|nr:MAG: hypothetical protein JSW27_12510 [Phycisphaerales bacterium]